MTKPGRISCKKGYITLWKVGTLWKYMKSFIYRSKNINVCISEAIRKIKISVSLLYSNDWTMSYEKYSVYYAIDVARENALNFSKKLHGLDGKPPGQFNLWWGLHLHDEF